LYNGNLSLTFILLGPCIVIYSYSKTNKKHLLSQIIYSCETLYKFRTSFRPSSGAQDCVYSDRHLSNSCCYLPLGAMRLDCSSISSPLTAGSSSCLTNACRCLCSLELLMMDEKNLPKHVECFTKINNLR